MSSRKSANQHEQPTPDDLAGIPVCCEETSAARTAGAAGHGIRAGAESSSRKPTADDLAGIAVSARRKEHRAVRPGKKGRPR